MHGCIMLQCNYTRQGFQSTLESVRKLQKNSTEDSQPNSETICNEYMNTYESTAERWEEDKQKFNFDQIVVLCSLMKKAKESAPIDQADGIDTTQIFRFLQGYWQITPNNTNNTNFNENADARTILNFSWPIQVGSLSVP